MKRGKGFSSVCGILVSVPSAVMWGRPVRSSASRTPGCSQIVQRRPSLLKTFFLRTRQDSQQGKGCLGCVFSLLVLAGLGYLGYKFLPPYVNHFQLKDAMNEIAVRHAAGRGGGSKAIQDSVLAKAKELQIPLRREDIRVRTEEERVFITVKYVVPVELPGRVYDLKFEFTGQN